MTAEDRQYWKSLERCVRCHEKDAFTMVGRSLCADCAEIDRQKKRERFDADPEKFRKRMVAFYNLRKENRLCVKCGEPLEPDNPRVRCLRCARKKAMYDHNAVERNRPPKQNYPRGDNGICYICNQRPTAEGRRCCETCYPQLRNRMLAARAAQDLDAHPWNQGRGIV